MHTQSKILILDDYADLLEVLTIFLKEESFNVCTVVSEELFNTELKRFKPDVIILDVYVKGNCDGRNICKMIKSNSETRDIPVILMSTSMQLLTNYGECNADAVIDKPFDLLFLLEIIRTLTRHHKEKMMINKRDKSSLLISLIKPTIQNENKYAG